MYNVKNFCLFKFIQIETLFYFVTIYFLFEKYNFPILASFNISYFSFF